MSFLSSLAAYFMTQNQARKDLTYNLGVLFLGARGGGVVLSDQLSTPPVDPENGDAYIVAASPTGAWAGHEDAIAVYFDGWRFIDPAPGSPVYVAASALYKNYDDGSPPGWVTLAIGGGVTDFLDLADVPAGYSGYGGKPVRVAAGENGLEFGLAMQSVTSAATVTPTFANDMVKITAQAEALTLANPTGTAEGGHGLVIRIKDNGTARAISYGSQYRAIGVTLPTTTVVSKTLYLGLVYNADDTKWDICSVAQEA